MIVSILLGAILVPLLTVNAIQRDLIYEACRRNPSLYFCDSHFFGRPMFDRPKSTTTTTTPSPTFGDDIFKEMGSWQEGFKDDTDDEDAEIEKSRRLHADKNQYCNKYKQNYQHYCQKGKPGELEGVLDNFCAAFRIACDGIIPGVKSEGNQNSEFPEPPDFEEDFEVDEKKEKTDKTKDYCKQFKPQYKALCFPPNKSTGEFCQSFNENCMKDPTSSSESSSTMALATPPAKQEGFLEEASTPSVEGAGAEVSSKVSEYCEKYSENYNYYCVGDVSDTNEKFCRSYRKSCPGKIGS